MTLSPFKYFNYIKLSYFLSSLTTLNTTVNSQVMEKVWGRREFCLKPNTIFNIFNIFSNLHGIGHQPVGTDAGKFLEGSCWNQWIWERVTGKGGSGYNYLPSSTETFQDSANSCKSLDYQPCWNPFNGPFSLRVKSKTLPWSPRRRPCMPPASSQLQALILSPLVHSLKFQDLKCSLPSASRPSQMLLFQPRTPVCPTSSTLPVNLLAHLECCISEQFLLTFYIKTGLLFTFHHSTLYFSFTAFNTTGIKLFVE